MSSPPTHLARCSTWSAWSRLDGAAEALERSGSSRATPPRCRSRRLVRGLVQLSFARTDADVATGRSPRWCGSPATTASASSRSPMRTAAGAGAAPCARLLPEASDSLARPRARARATSRLRSHRRCVSRRACWSPASVGPRLRRRRGLSWSGPYSCLQTGLARAMRILFAMKSTAELRSLGGVVSTLADRGHESGSCSPRSRPGVERAVERFARSGEPHRQPVATRPARPRRRLLRTCAGAPTTFTISTRRSRRRRSFVGAARATHPPPPGRPGRCSRPFGTS